MNNNISKVWLFVLLTILLVGALRYLPALSIGGHTLRRVNLLADILTKEPEPQPLDSVPLPRPVKPIFVDTCRTGMTCIEDYADSTHREMSAFYEALNECHQRPVRIAYFGDSFIEGDILTGDLRSMLQKRFGGSGVGYVDITSSMTGFRSTVKHRFHGWSSHGPLDSIGYHRRDAGLSNHYFRAYPGARAEYVCDTCQRSILLVEALKGADLKVLLNGRDTSYFHLEPATEMQMAVTEGRLGKVEWQVEVADSALFFGVSMESKQGIVLDNFGQRSSSGLLLKEIPMRRLRDFNRLRPYDLIVLQYGLNVATERGINYDWYEKGMTEVIKHLKEAFPRASILLVSVGDREFRDEEGNLRTMPGVKNLIRYQQNIAAKMGIAFWNLYDAMGGEGSISDMVNARQANLDYTHINFRGGKVLAEKLFETLIYGKEQYDKRKKYEEE